MVQGSILFAGVLAALIAVFTIVYLHVRPRCSDEIVGESASPDQRWVATVLQLRCGEESPFVTHINLRLADRSIQYGFFSGKAEEGEIFSIEQDAEALRLNLVWDLSNQLTVHCHECVNPNKRQDRWGNVLIRYEVK